MVVETSFRRSASIFVLPPSGHRDEQHLRVPGSLNWYKNACYRASKSWPTSVNKELHHETKRISDKMEKALNDQMTREAYQAQVYLSYASWAEVNGFAGIAAFLYKHMNEERQHMFKFVKF